MMGRPPVVLFPARSLPPLDDLEQVDPPPTWAHFVNYKINCWRAEAQGQPSPGGRWGEPGGPHRAAPARASAAPPTARPDPTRSTPRSACPPRFASSCPAGLRSASYQPLKRFSRFQVLSPCRISTSLYAAMATAPGATQTGTRRDSGVVVRPQPRLRARTPLPGSRALGGANLSTRWGTARLPPGVRMRPVRAPRPPGGRGALEGGRAHAVSAAGPWSAAAVTERT